jgi:hypothetical protein
VLSNLSTTTTNKRNKNTIQTRKKDPIYKKQKWRGMLDLHPRLNSTRKGITEPDKATLEEGGSARFICLAIARLEKKLISLK